MNIPVLTSKPNIVCTIILYKVIQLSVHARPLTFKKSHTTRLRVIAYGQGASYSVANSRSQTQELLHSLTVCYSL